jgi:hypothetical protein
MFNGPIYVPMLKGKEGEFAALEGLELDIRDKITPLIEVPNVPYDYANDRPAKSLDSHVAGIGERLNRCWRSGPLYLDLPWFQNGEYLEDGRLALAAVLTDCSERGLSVIPVVSTASSESYLRAAGDHARRFGTGVCLRLLVRDFEDNDPDSATSGVLERTGPLTPENIDVLLDLEDLGTDSGRAVLIARSVLSMLPEGNWRRIILAGASFPSDLSEVSAARTTTLPRREWQLWQTLHKRPGPLRQHNLIFGDYAVAHPVPTELDPRTMRMSASIRYTTPDSWLVVKGRNVRQYGFEQYFELSRSLVSRPEYCGRDFSWGDGYLSDCAAGVTGPGNATTWRKVGTNHHITLVARELANRASV